MTTLRSETTHLLHAAQTMRRNFVSHIRRHRQAESGAGSAFFPPGHDMGLGTDDVVVLSDALERLGEMDLHQAQIVELRLFGGLAMGEIAETLGAARGAIARDWESAVSWLRRNIADNSALRDTPHTISEAEIGQLYDDIARLVEQNRTSPDPALEEQIEVTWKRLRHLQSEEADRFYEAFESSLNMPIDAGARILKDMKSLRKKLEDLAAPKSSAEGRRIAKA